MTFRLVFASITYMEQDEKRKEMGALLVAACLIAAIRLRGEPIDPSPRLSATIYDSVQLATLVLRQLQNRYQ